MQITIAIFLLIYIGYNYFTPFILFKQRLPKPLSCGGCMSFWCCLAASLFFYSIPLSIIIGCSAFLIYQLFYKYL